MKSWKDGEIRMVNSVNVWTFLRGEKVLKQKWLDMEGSWRAGEQTCRDTLGVLECGSNWSSWDWGHARLKDNKSVKTTGVI